MYGSDTDCPVLGESFDGLHGPQKEVEAAPFQHEISSGGDKNCSPNISNDGHKPGPEKKLKAASFHRRKSSPYTEPFLKKMLDNVRDGTMSMYHVEKYHGIPRATLQYRLGQKFKNKGRPGPDTVLTAEEECVVVQWLQTMERRGFPITRHALITRVAAYLRRNPRKNPCRDNVPGRKWLEGFMRRHSELTFRTPESVTSASAKVSEADIRKWFRTVLDYLIEHDLIDALYDPSRILNGDETGFVMNSSPKKVLATKGAKNVPIVDTQNGKQNVTVLFSFSANGKVIPPDIILPYKRLSREIVQSFPSDWGLGTSETGWMNASNFTLYIKKVLYPSLVKSNVKFPVLYFVDGHKSHTALEAADACAELGIVLIALYPNATRILQPADVSIFRPLKHSWGKVVEIWKTEHMAERLSIPSFGSLLQETMKTAFKEPTIINAFRVCGLYPFNADAVDYSKCIARSHSQPEPALQSPDSSAMPMVERFVTLVPTTAIKSALSLIGDEKVDLYKSGDQNSFSNEDKALYFIYHNILTVNQSSNHDASYNYEVEHSNNIDREAAITEPLILLEDGSEFAAGPFINSPRSEREYGHPTEDTNDVDPSVDPNVNLQMILNGTDDFNNIDLEAAIAEPMILLDDGTEFAAGLSINGSPTARDYGHPTEDMRIAEPTEASIAEPLILLDDGSEFTAGLSTNGSPTARDYGHPTEDMRIAKPTEATMAEPLILLDDGTERAAGLSTNGSPTVRDYGHPTEDMRIVEPTEATIAEPLILLDDGVERAAGLSTNGSPTARDYGHLTEDMNDVEVAIANPLMLLEDGTDPASGQSTSDEALLDEEHPNEDTNDIGAAIDDSLVLYEEGITRDLQLLSDFTANQSSNQEETYNYENYYDVQELNALHFNGVDWNLDLEHDLLSSDPKQSASETLGGAPNTNGPSKIRVSAAEFFQAPPTPKRNPTHRHYRQKSHAILTAGERLEELRQIDINKAEAEKAKKEKAEERTQKKLMKAAAALMRAEEKENAKNLREMKKQVAAQAKAERQKAKKIAGKAKEKKQLVL